jgi:myosin heavy subunit
MINTNFSYEEINLVLALTLGILFIGNIEFKENGEV